MRLIMSLIAVAALSQQPPAPLHVLKISSGPAGAESKGVFTLTEERSAFDRSEDREIIVFFQWEGVPGPHRLVLESKPKKTDLRKNALSLSFWEIPMLSAPGTYRAEVMLDEKAVWRGFVAVTP